MAGVVSEPDGARSLHGSTGFRAGGDIATLLPGESQTIEIKYIADMDNASGSYGIINNDNDENEVKCQTNGNINGINIGESAPDFELNIIANGNGPFRLSDHLDQIVVIAFFSPM